MELRGTANTGGGGGGAAGGTGGVGGAGGSGIVIIRYKASTMAVTTQPSLIVPAGTNFAQPVVIQILDGNGLAVAGIVVTASIQSGTGGTLNNNTATTDASGNATFTNLQLSGPAGNAYTLNFQVPGSGIVVVSNTINLCACPAVNHNRSFQYKLQRQQRWRHNGSGKRRLKPLHIFNK